MVVNIESARYACRMAAPTGRTATSGHASLVSGTTPGRPRAPTEAARPLEAAEPDQPELAGDIRLLAALADPIRLAIVRQLADCGSVCVCDLEACRWVSQPTVSHHLRVLREAGLVRSERRGTWMYYSLESAALNRLGSIVERLRAPALATGCCGGVDGPETDGTRVGKRRLPLLQAGSTAGRRPRSGESRNPPKVR